MRNIEDEILCEGQFVMEKNWLIYGRDLKRKNQLCNVPDQRKNLINTICSRYANIPDYQPSTHSYFIIVFFALILTPWLLLTVFAFILT